MKTFTVSYMLSPGRIEFETTPVVSSCEDGENKFDDLELNGARKLRRAVWEFVKDYMDKEVGWNRFDSCESFRNSDAIPNSCSS
jgi:hypothetical protein